MLNLVARRNWFYLFSIVLLIPGIISLLIPPRLRPGIEFTPLTMIPLDAAIIFGVQEYQFTGKSIMIKS